MRNIILAIIGIVVAYYFISKLFVVRKSFSDCDDLISYVKSKSYSDLTKEWGDGKEYNQQLDHKNDIMTTIEWSSIKCNGRPVRITFDQYDFTSTPNTFRMVYCEDYSSSILSEPASETPNYDSINNINATLGRQIAPDDYIEPNSDSSSTINHQIGLYVITAAKTYFYSIDNTVMKSYLVKDDIISVESWKDDFVFAKFQAKSGYVTSGYIKASDIQIINSLK